MLVLASVFACPVSAASRTRPGNGTGIRHPRRGRMPREGIPLARRPWIGGPACRGGTVMHIVIMGCGRVGSTLAHILEDRDNTVSVIDRDPEAFRRLGSGFKGDRVTGVGFDQVGR